MDTQRGVLQDRTANLPESKKTYAALQRRYDDLERSSTQEKKSYQSTIERLKSEVSRHQKAQTDSVASTEKQKKHSEALELKIAELKKSLSQADGDLRELRVKLRAVEHERSQLESKAEARRKDDIRDRDRKIVDLEKALATERKKREASEAKFAGLKAKGDADVRAVQNELTKVRNELDAVRGVAEESAQENAALHADLEDSKVLIQSCASAYASLSASSTPNVKYLDLQSENLALTFRIGRLERKLANSEGQVAELAYLVRYMQEDNALLTNTLRSAHEEIASYQTALKAAVKERVSLEEDCRFWTALDITDDCTPPLPGPTPLVEFYHLQFSELLEAYAASDAERHDTTNRLTESKQAWDVSEQLRKAATELSDSLKVSSELLKQQVRDLEAKLEKERDSVSRLSVTVQKGRMTEEALRAEIGQLTAEIAEAERYQAAYYTLSDQVDELIARKALAEEEADKLSKFNAEILGHNNPAQRIMYLERIRHELAETKQQLVTAVRDREAVLSQNNGLEHELSMYRSIQDTKTRLNRTPVLCDV